LTEVVLNYKGQRSLQNLNQAELTSPFFNIREDLAKTAVAYGMLEVLQKLMREHEAVPDFFDYLTALLGKLDQSPFGAEPFLWHFLLTISEVLGFGWQLGFFPDSGEIPGLFPVHLDERRGCIAPGAGHQHSLRLDKTAWETLTDWAQRPPQELDTAGDPRGLPLQITQVLLRYLSHHTETPLVLNSLKWYVQ
ncbi:MAG TPA: DNA repair protein RecO C-terminal domain-containing protein, partial [Calditrichia bacterium]|nr:DNA repair protein RecO C-terminal domain-containing protein [Calditrichia bacterium]